MVNFRGQQDVLFQGDWNIPPRVRIFPGNDMHIIYTVVSTLLSLAIADRTAASTSGLDPRFGTGGVVLLGGTPVNGQQIARTSGIAVQADGKILLAGRASGLKSRR
jgi:hypothetical protein